MALALPKLRWLVIGAIAAGIWVMREETKGPRPPERVPAWTERSQNAKPQPSKQTTTARAERTAVSKPAPAKAVDRPVPPKPLAGNAPAPQKAAAAKAPAHKPGPPKTALPLPEAVDRPPAKPQNIATGSITRPKKPSFVQTKSKVFMRAQAKADAPIIATLAPRTVMRELARSGEWRLLMGDGRKGGVRADYLAEPNAPPRRPKMPVAETRQAASQ